MGCGSSHDAQALGVVPAAAPAAGASSGSAPSANSAPAPAPATPQGHAAPMPPGRMQLPVPVSVLTDSYKASHFLMYPEARLMVAYGEFRAPFQKDATDTRFVFFGMRYIVETFLHQQWTEQDVEQAARFYSTHNAGFGEFPFPKDLFLKFVRENQGYFPVRIEALPEGTVANVRVPVYQIFAEKEYSRLITFLESILTQVWYPTCVATLSRRTKELIEDGFEKSVDEEFNFLADYKLHDFGFRGCTCVEQSILGGTAHLLSFSGSDTMSACYHAQYNWNNGKPVGTSIPATEHSVMTSWPNERLAMENMIDKFGGDNAVFAIVMDSYDYDNALTKVLPAVADAHKAKGGMMVLRPDSGDPVQCILSAMEAGEKNFPTKLNKKGYKVIEGMAAIQGDGIDYAVCKQILDATIAAGFSAQNVTFGMGGGLLQKVNRDTMSFATKLSYIVYADGTDREVMKRPKTDGGKLSLPGILKVRRDGGKLIVEPRTPDEKYDAATNELRVVYDHGPVAGAFDDFSTVKQRVAEQWKQCPRVFDPIGEGMQQRIANWIKNFDVSYEAMMKDIERDAAAAAEKQKAAAATADSPDVSPSPPAGAVAPAPASDKAADEAEASKVAAESAAQKEKEAAAAPEAAAPAAQQEEEVVVVQE